MRIAAGTWILLLLPAVAWAQVDLDGLPERFAEVERSYARSSGNAVHDGTQGVSSWGFLRDHLQPYDVTESPYRTGQTGEFLRRLGIASQRAGRPLDPVDLYRISLPLNQGNRLAALTTVHDALKELGRAALVGPVDEATMRARVGDRFFDRYMQGRRFSPLDDANPMGEAYLASILQPIGAADDFTGKYYHLFGTAAAGLVGGIAGVAPRLHARAKDTQSVVRDVERQTRDFYGDGLVGRALGLVSRPVAALASGLGSFGEYTIVYKDKWNADQAGLAVGRALRDQGDLGEVPGLDNGPAVSDYARGLRGGDDATTPATSSPPGGTSTTTAQPAPVSGPPAAERTGISQRLGALGR